MDLNFANSILDKFFDFLQYKKNIINIISIEKFDSHIENNLLQGGKYLDNSIVCDLKKMNYGERRNIKINNINLLWEFWDNKLIDNKIANFICDYSCFIIYYLNKINTNSRDINLYLYNYDEKKIKPIDGILRSINVNSGLTLYSHDNSEVLVYRKEEMIKVLTHELIHALGIDAKYIDDMKVINITNKFCTTNNININETFTDAFACLINLVMFTILKDGKNDFNKKYKLNFKLELDFIKAQAHNILLLNNYNLSNSDITCKYKNLEETNGIAYYVLKALIFKTFPEFIIKQNYMLKDEASFINLINNSIANVNWRTFGKNEYFKLKNKRTLRMSSIDIKKLINFKKTI